MIRKGMRTIWLIVFMSVSLSLCHYAFGADQAKPESINEDKLQKDAKIMEQKIKEWSDENLSNIINNMEGVLKAERLPDSETRMIFKNKRKKAQMKLILLYIGQLREIYKKLGYSFDSKGSSRDDTAMWNGGAEGSGGGDGVSGGLSGPGLQGNKKDERLGNAGGDTAGEGAGSPGLGPDMSSGPGVFGSDFSGDDILLDDPFYADPDYGLEVLGSESDRGSESTGGGDVEGEQGGGEEPGGLF